MKIVKLSVIKKWLKLFHSIQHDPFMPNVIEGENIVNTDRFGTTKVSSIDHNVNCLEFVLKFSLAVKELLHLLMVLKVPHVPSHLLDVLTRMRLLITPKFFMTLSSVDLRWNEQLPITNKLNKQDLADKDIQTLSNHDRCKFLNSNPAFIVRHFQCQVEIRFKKIIVDGTLRKVI